MKRCQRCGASFRPRAHYHFLCWSCWRIEQPGSTRSVPPAPTVALGLDVDTLRAAITLTHPDRHPAERAELANKVTAALIGAMRRLQGRAA